MPVNREHCLAIIRNPFYLISALLMLIASLPINLSTDIDEQTMLIRQTVVYQFLVYELLLFAGFYILKTMVNNKIDAWMLLLLAILFAVDPTFTWFRSAGDEPNKTSVLLFINGAFGLAKIWLGLQALNVQSRQRHMILCSSLFAAYLFLMHQPVLLQYGNEIKCGNLFWFWGLLFIPTILFNYIAIPTSQRPFVFIVDMVLLWFALMHLVFCQFIYSIDMYPAWLQVPVILLLVKVINRDQDKATRTLILLMGNLSFLLLTVCARQTAVYEGIELVSSFNVSMLLMGILHIYLSILFRYPALSVLSVFYILCACIGRDWHEVGEHIGNVTPDSAVSWGLIGILAAFACAGIGMFLSIKRGNTLSEEVK